MKNPNRALLVSLSAASALCWTLASAAAAPDFTGLWTNYQQAGGPGQRGGGPAPAFKPEVTERLAKYQRVTTGTNYTPGGYCVGTGMPGSMLGSGGYPMEIMQRAEQINVTYEAHGEMRRIYFGDRVADPKDVFPERNGYSIGRWDGETLIVETDHLVEQIDQRFAHSADANIVERYTIATEADGRRVLTATMTMTDPVVPHGTVHDGEEVAASAERAVAELRMHRTAMARGAGTDHERRRTHEQPNGERSTMKTLISKSVYAVLGAFVALSMAQRADAHHSAAQFNFQTPVNVTGIVKLAQFSNPHAKIVLSVTDDKHGTRDVEFEGHSRNNMYRQGFRPNMMNVGDTITVRIAPMRDGNDGGYVTALITADGQAIGNITKAD